MVDWDEDGDTDLLVGEYDGHVHYFKNIGTATNPQLTNMGHLQCAGVDIDVSQLAIPVVLDWDEDGRKDLLIGNDLANMRVYLNVGTNAAPLFNTFFYLQTTPPISQIKNAPDIGDLNGDGLKDLAFGWWQGTCVFYANSGTNAAPIFDGAFELSTLTGIIDPGGWTHLELNDWDEDGDPDLLYGEWNGDIYLHYNLTTELTLSAGPVGGPVVIPASGGSFSFSVAVTNAYTSSVPGTIWTVAKLPSGQYTGALLQVPITMPAGVQLTRIRSQNVPATAPAGDYEYIIRWGTYPDRPWAESRFPFTKLATGDGTPIVGDWTCSGAPFGDESGAVAGDFALIGAFPNPFNPETQIRYTLPQAAHATLAIYDFRGRLVNVVTNGWREASSHEVTFDGTDLASGIYFARLSANGLTAMQKLVLVK
jgi:hypothetical protein